MNSVYMGLMLQRFHTSRCCHSSACSHLFGIRHLYILASAADTYDSLPGAFIWLLRHTWAEMQGRSIPQEWPSINAKCEVKKESPASCPLVMGITFEVNSHLPTAVTCWLIHTVLASFPFLPNVISQINNLHSDLYLGGYIWETQLRPAPSKFYCD